MTGMKSYLTLRQDLTELVLVAIGAVPGAVLRWQLGVHWADQDLIANVAGAFLLGLLAGLPTRPRRQLLVGIGFCGSLTTFSSWMVNSVKLLASGQWVAAVGLIALTLGLGLGAAAVGFGLGGPSKDPRQADEVGGQAARLPQWPTSVRRIQDRRRFEAGDHGAVLALRTSRSSRPHHQRVPSG